ncbi:helix-turn-helix domain-containing protein [Streptomyces chartreusis]|jgi:transcriptional regulator with XRE-family HTH domain|uniref:helix-turn-helix domain-containing protein n=1 Tax=Streptomyces chartreusis TaxID=1969 RepID=UPI0038706872|nr:helix-turn-helix domain-containing protein [Streptomyces chartreusis]
MSDALGSAEEIFGRRVKALRVARGWSQQELSTRMNDQGNSWRQTTVAKTEAADRPIRINEAVDLSVIFGVPVVELLSVPMDDVEAARRVMRLAELTALASAATQRVNECERAHLRTADDLAQARLEAERITAELNQLQRQHEEDLARGEQEHQEASER